MHSASMVGLAWRRGGWLVQPDLGVDFAGPETERV
jgi:hypothetical protein